MSESAGVVVWFTGRPGAGKSSLAQVIRRRLARDGVRACVLDSDEVRDAWVPRRGYGALDRDHHYATLARFAALLARQGFVVLVPATAHLRRYRDDARAIAPRFVEVFVGTDAATCASRDPKGLYAAAERGGVTQLPGVHAAYEEPVAPEFAASGARDEVAITAIAAALLR